MANLNPKTTQLVRTQWKPGQSGNPSGKPKGTRHISSWIQELLSDTQFQATITGPGGKVVKYKGAPIQAIVQTAIIHAIQGDKNWGEWLAKYGFPSGETNQNNYYSFLEARKKYDI